MPLIRNGYRI